MIIEESHLLKLIKGLQNFQKTGAAGSIAPVQKDAEPSSNRLIDPFLSDLLAQSFVCEQKVLNEINRDESLPGNQLKTHQFSPLAFSLDLTFSKNRPLFFEFFHLCEKHNYFLHPAAIPLLLKQPLPYRIKAEILSRVDSKTLKVIESHPDLNAYWVDKPVIELGENQSIILWWHFWARKISPKILVSEIWELISPGQKKEILQSAGPIDCQRLSVELPINFTTNSRKYNTILLACALAQPKFYLSIEVVEFLRSYIKDQAQKNIPESLVRLKNSYPFTIRHWISFLLAATPPANWLNDESFGELKKLDFSSLSREIYRSLLESAVKFNHERLFLLIVQRIPCPQIVNCLQEFYKQSPETRITSSFFHKVSGAMLYKAFKPPTLVIIDSLWNFYEGFVSNAISEAILHKLKDPEYKLLQSEKGIKTGGLLCEKLAYSANPLLLKTIQLMPGNFVFHPLEDSFEKILTCWRYRLKMRKAFID